MQSGSHRALTFSGNPAATLTQLLAHEQEMASVRQNLTVQFAMSQGLVPSNFLQQMQQPTFGGGGGSRAGAAAMSLMQPVHQQMQHQGFGGSMQHQSFGGGSGGGSGGGFGFGGGLQGTFSGGPHMQRRISDSGGQMHRRLSDDPMDMFGSPSMGMRGLPFDGVPHGRFH